MTEWMDGLKRAVGLKRTFRRTGASALSNIALGAAVGVVSGYYIFATPLKEYWQEQERLEQAAAATSGTTSTTTIAGSASS
mmetsp:Transcript_69/g.119  ORF Transcript_69/g.119 Transcript_69/m.119 type:complete len:81 (+) Transcript_69:148-390(+)|eukprot:CAMPEP_0119010240 /NCGR_PEP_ID=MMETSP1176-20130426/4882_1 /TAXON_ID=265551 /ORGANISM="Synedropsis recta cf, Strain CCMP1620" /LENGTH=80 /DNA_ID=CAMNT_0006962867 /DNA_START=161 /DNA_END=403 /DNA_ORIENTATION=-